ncbi:VWA domain-containing protein [Candidatus Parcubacteria bacterium]|nr:MAG: VWA domain-containing protein [Candidatus Parcubacteria bacterium]
MEKREEIIAKERSLCRWRMVLGKYSDRALGCPLECSGGESLREMDEILDFLYSREYTEDRGIRDGDLSDSQLTVPSWISKIKELFPEETVEILEHDALERYELKELLTNKEVLEKIEPDINLLKSILNFKNLMPEDVLATARGIIRKVVEELTDKLKQELYQAFSGSPDRNRRSFIKVYKNLDWKKTIRRNLDNYDTERKKIFLEDMFFFGRVRKRNTWHIILLVDQSGSMADSVIHSAVVAGIFSSLPSLKTSIVVFDTSVVDLTEYADDPVEILMSVQLGGGTDAGQALRYAEDLIEFPHRTIIVLISDFFEGAPEENLLETAARLIESKVKFLGLAALDEKADPVYNKHLAEKIVALGGNVAALTPQKLAQWVAKIVNE